MIRVNDRMDPNQPSLELSGAEVVDDSGTRRVILVEPCEFTARLANTPNPAARFNISIGDLDVAEGELPDIWYGVVESWQPQGSKILITCRPARTVEESVHL